MSERGGDPASRPIPDGGLGSSMPSWVRDTPAWKRGASDAPARELPPPDDSPIDPRTMLQTDDLPAWLRDLASGSPPTEQTAAGGATATVLSGTEGSVPPAEQENHGAGVLGHGSEARTGPERPSLPWWQSDAAIAVLFGAVLLALIYVILVASDVL